MSIKDLRGVKIGSTYGTSRTTRRKGRRSVRSHVTSLRGPEPLESRWLLSGYSPGGLPGEVFSGWALGGNAFDDARAVAVDTQQRLIVAGTTFSAGWTSGGFDTSWGGEGDAYIAKFSSDGEHLWSTYLGGSYDDGVAALVVDQDGFIYVAGWTRSSGWVSGGYDTSYGGAGDCFVAKLSPEGNYLWATYLGGSNWDAASALCLTGDGRLFVAGTTSSSGWIRKGFDTTYNGGTFDAFAALISPDGEFLWSTYLGGTGWDYGYAVAATDDGLFVAGKTSSSNWVSKGFDLTYAGGNFDGYLVRLSVTGQHVWSTYLGGTGEEAAVSLASGNDVLYVVGDTTSTDLPFPGIQESRGSRDGFAVAVSTDGECLWGTRLGGTDIDQATAILDGGSGSVVVAGTTTSDHWLADGSGNARCGEADGFVVRLCPTNGEILWGRYLGGPQNDTPLTLTRGPGDTVCVAGMTYSVDWLPNDPWGDPLGDADAFVATIWVNQPPEVGALSVDRQMINAPSIVDFCVSGITDADGSEDVQGVLFYHDVNGDGLLDDGDRLLGQTDQLIDGTATWRLEITAEAWPIGHHRVFALAYDRTGQVSHPVSVDLVVTKLVDLGQLDCVQMTEDEWATGVVVYRLIATHDAFLSLLGNADLPAELSFTLYDVNPLEDPDAILIDQAVLNANSRAAEMVSLRSGEDYYLVVESPANESTWAMMNLHGCESSSGNHIFWDTKSDDIFELSWNPDSAQKLVARAVINGNELSLSLAENPEPHIIFYSVFGSDTMMIEDTSADDTFTGWLDRTVFVVGDPEGESSPNGGACVEAVGFEQVHMYGRRGGFDTATLYDRTSTGEVAAKMKLKCEPHLNHVKTIARQGLVRVKFFEKVEVFADGAGDQAVFYDSSGDDFFTTTLSFSQMTGPGYDVIAHGFPFVRAYSTNGGTDRVHFVDSIMKDEFAFKPHKSELFDQVTGGTIYHIIARAFERVLAEAAIGTGGRDKAAIWDTVFSDDVQAFGERLTLTRMTPRPELLLEIQGFEFVKVRPSSGGEDRVSVLLPLEMELIIGEGWRTI